LVAAWMLAAFFSSKTADHITTATGWMAIVIFAFKDGFGGYSPGKYLMGIQVVDRFTRQPIGFRQSFKRNLSIGIPFVTGIAVFIIALSPLNGLRSGDSWARTMVIWRKHERKAPFEPLSTVCIPCGYDLTGNVSGVCPECGTPIPENTRRLLAAKSPVIASTSAQE